MNRDIKFREGQLVIYIGMSVDQEYGVAYAEIYKTQVGRIKKINGDKAFVYYHSGETAACTNINDLYPIENESHINEVDLGGEGIRKVGFEWKLMED